MIPLPFNVAKRLAPRIAIMMIGVQVTVRQTVKVPGGTTVVTTPT